MKKFSLVLAVVVLVACLVAPAVAHGATTYNARVYAKAGTRAAVAYRPGNLTLISWTAYKTIPLAGYVDFTGLSGTPVYAKNLVGTTLRQIPVTGNAYIGGKLFYLFDFNKYIAL